MNAHLLPKTVRELGGGGGGRGLSCVKVPGVNGLKDSVFAAVKRDANI